MKKKKKGPVSDLSRSRGEQSGLGVVKGLGCRVYGLGLKNWGLGLRVFESLGRIGLGFRV